MANTDIRVLTWLFGVAAPFAGIACNGSDARSLTPLVTDGKSEHDFGKCRPGDVLEHIFKVVNRSSKPLEILDVKTSCACLVRIGRQSHQTITVDPGSAFELPMRFVIGPTFEDAVTGRILVTYRNSVVENERPLWELDLRVRAEVEPDYRISPSVVDFGEVDGLTTTTLTRAVQIMPFATGDFKIYGVFSPSSHLRARIEEPTGNGAKLNVTIQADFGGFTENRSLDGHLVIKSNSPRVPQALLATRGSFVAPIQLAPTSIIIGSDENGEVRRALTVRTTRKSRILSVEGADEEQTRAEFDHARNAMEHVVEIVVAATPDASINRNLLFEIELAVDSQRRITRRIPLNVHRFPKGGSHE